MMSHGYTVKEERDPIVSLVDLATEQFSESTRPGAFFVDVLPALRYLPSWFPGAGFKRYAAKVRPYIGRAALDHPWAAMVKAKVACLALLFSDLVFTGSTYV